jgi:hypothetical protein
MIWSIIFWIWSGDDMKNLMQAEVYRFLHTPRMIALLLGLIVVSGIGNILTSPAQADSGYAFLALMGDERYLGFYGALLCGYNFCLDYQNRTCNIAICRGYGRAQIYLVKLVSYVLLTTVVSLLSACVAISMHGAWSLDAGYALRIFGLRFVLDLRIWAVPLVIVHGIKKLMPSILLGFAYAFLLLSSSNSQISAWFSSDAIWLYATASLGIFLACAGSGYALFCRADMK